MPGFTASNEITVTNLGGNSDRTTIQFEGEVLGLPHGQIHRRAVLFNDRDFEALREFFQHQWDQFLGRWRAPEYLGYVVYKRGDDQIRVLRESDGVTWEISRDENAAMHLDSVGGRTREYVARAYFNAHGPKLPTEPGLYSGGILSGLPTIWNLTPTGMWVLINTGAVFPTEDGHIQKYLPFTRLVEEAAD